MEPGYCYSSFFFTERIDFEFIINLVLIQKVIVYTAGITTSLQKRVDLVSLNDQIQLVIRTLQNVRKDVSNFHHDCHEQATKLAQKIDVEVKMPRIFGRQTHQRMLYQVIRQINHLSSKLKITFELM